ncbi:hypothetical protein N7448_010915 [Penicillium atrosanguineum]|nr:hypothetical protein N7448_010915 [Penicillium atrosanguineum]
MHWIKSLLWSGVATAAAQPTDGLYSLVKRRLPDHFDQFRFNLDANFGDNDGYDQFRVQSADNGTVLLHGNSISALSSGLHRYLTEIVHVDIYWFVGSRLGQAPSSLPRFDTPILGSSTVPWRYHFNTVTFSYTSAFWTWEEWELQLDWLALRGVNLPLASVGQEKIMVDVFQEIGLTGAEISTFLSGPAFLAWNRFGNIQGSWGGSLPQTWIDQQFGLSKKIVKRMVELGMTPVLPAFTGYVPMNTSRVLPNANIVRGSQWSGFSSQYSNDSFLQPFDDNFARIQNLFIGRQKAAYGNVSHIYTLDQYNENNPYSGDPGYLHNITRTTWHSLKEADPDAIWLMQGWLFYSSESFWTSERVEAYLSGVGKNSDMLILDLFSESMPQWRRTNSYYGKPWIWCQLHDYGGQMGLYGQIQNITQNATQARLESPSMVGYGLSPEGQEGNEVVYDMLLDQAWSSTPLDTESYFHAWVASRYSGCGSIPQELYKAWDLMRTTIYNNTNLTTTAVMRPVFVSRPQLSGLVGVAGSFGTVLTYDPLVLVWAWRLMYHAASSEPRLWSNPSYRHDMVDVTRQIMANAFTPLYLSLTSTYNNSDSTQASLSQKGTRMIQLLADIDSVLLTNKNFRLSTWIESARAWAGGDKKQESFFEYSARNQITLWGPDGEISDYAAKQWGGLLSSYYVPRWRIFVEYLKSTPAVSYNASMLQDRLLEFELKWQKKTWAETEPTGDAADLEIVLARVIQEWPSIFGHA